MPRTRSIEGRGAPVRCAVHGIVALAATLAIAGDAAAQTRAAHDDSSQAGWRIALSRREIDGLPGSEVEGIDFITRHVGWAVGRGSGAATMIFRTADGGKTWERLPMFDGEQHGRSLMDVRFWDARHGWILGRSELLHTSDGGETWEPVEGADHVWGTALLPLGPDVAVVAAENGEISVTSRDGRRLETLAKFDQQKVNGVAFAPPNQLYAVLGHSYGQSGAIVRSTDGGHNWEIAAEGDKPLSAIAFRDARHGIAVGENIAWRTEDGGASWRRTMVPGNRLAVRYIDDRTVVSVGTTPGVAVSRDGGRTWRAFPGPPTKFHLADIDVVDPGWWFVAGGYGVHEIYHYVSAVRSAPLARAVLPIPGDIRLAGGRTLRAGMYELTLAHAGDDHVVSLERTGDAPAASESGEASAAAESTVVESADADDAGAAPDAESCAGSCDAVFPVEAEYEIEEVAPGRAARPRVRVSLEPTATGVAIVFDAAVTPPRDARLTLAALGAAEESSVETGAIRKAASGGGGLLARARRAAAGDVAGALDGVDADPKAAASRATAAKASPPAIYRIRVRHTLDLVKSAPTAR